jgi:biotin carboxyl carrier protein
MAEVFISYSRKDVSLIEPIASRLAELGVNTWFDRDTPTGERYRSVLRTKLREARVILVCWSPNAVESEWVDFEAEYALELGSYFPVFIAPCALMPPFRGVQTPDVSDWLVVVDQLAKRIGREGVAAGARALAVGNEQALYDFARRFPEEPAAARIWSDAEVRQRAEFNARLDEARIAAAARIARVTAEAADLDARIEAAVPAFEAWLADQRRGAADGPRPDPMAFVRHHVSSEVKKRRDDVAALSAALVQSKVAEEELEAAKAEVERLKEELAGRNEELDRIRNDLVAEQVRVPDIGDFTDIPIIEIFVKAGDAVKVDDSLVTLESDKATMDVPSPVGGVISNVCVRVGDKVSMGTLLATVLSASKHRTGT